MQNNNVQFSHRPESGISVGVYSDGNKVYVATAIVNNGQSNSGLYYPERQDNFSRKMARNIITGRIDAMRDGDSVPFGITFPALGIDIRGFMAALRSEFKPDFEESDLTFMSEVNFGDFIVRQRDTADNIWNEIVNMSERAMHYAHENSNI